MARKQRDEMAFGSDSFLDVVANIVGILIILIVVVGVRVAHSPPSTTNSETPEFPGPALQAADTSASPSVPAELPPLPEAAPLPEITPPRDLVLQAQALERERDALTAQLRQLDGEQQRLASLLSKEEAEAAVLKSSIVGKVEALRNERSQVSSLEADLLRLRNEVGIMRQNLAELQSDASPIQKLTHQLPPIGRVVTGNEIHFRLAHNRVSRVPISELAAEVQHDIERRKEILLSRSFYQGSTRPIDGYMMEYVLQRMTLTLAEELRHGRGTIRIGVSGWIIRPTGAMPQETAAEALRSGSNFQLALQREGPTATVTFWVYPDSFEIHRELKAFVHDAGFWVASRPLPEGVPIAGSPQGSKSLAQ